jgi:hypothetical protein
MPLSREQIGDVFDSFDDEPKSSNNNRGNEPPPVNGPGNYGFDAVEAQSSKPMKANARRFTLFSGLEATSTK